MSTVMQNTIYRDMTNIFTTFIKVIMSHVRAVSREIFGFLDLVRYVILRPVANFVNRFSFNSFIEL